MLENERIALAQKHLEKAQKELNASQSNMDMEYYEVANSRAYYAIFNAIRALLALEGVDFKSHSQTIGYFNKNFVNTGIFPKSIGKIISYTSTKRNNSDYNVNYEPGFDDVQKSVEGAAAFLKEVTQNIRATTSPS